jgi:hypothetical protein
MYDLLPSRIVVGRGTELCGVVDLRRQMVHTVGRLQIPNYARSGKWMLCSNSLQRGWLLWARRTAAAGIFWRHLVFNRLPSFTGGDECGTPIAHMDLFVSSRERGLPKYLAPSRFFAMSTLELAHSRRGQCSADRAGAMPLSKDTGCRCICRVQQATAGDHKGLLSAIHFCRMCRVLQSSGE